MSEIVVDSFANLKIFDSKLEKIGEINSEHYILDANSNTEMILYWDTKDIDKGVYDSDLKINYLDKSIESGFKVDVQENSMTFTGIGFVISSGEGLARFNMMTLLYIIIGVLVLINLIWLVIYVRTKINNRKK